MRTIFLILTFFLIFLQKQAFTEPKIIKRISETENFVFDFEQLINDKKETGNCIISFNNKIFYSYIKIYLIKYIFYILIQISEEQ